MGIGKALDAHGQFPSCHPHQLGERPISLSLITWGRALPFIFVDPMGKKCLIVILIISARERPTPTFIGKSLRRRRCVRWEVVGWHWGVVPMPSFSEAVGLAGTRALQSFYRT